MADAIAYTGPEGRIFRETLYAGAQYRAVRSTMRGPVARWFDTERAAIAWLRKKHAADLAKRFAARSE